MSYSKFFTREFASLDLKDVRLTRRAMTIGNTLIRSPGSCIQEVFSSKNEARCAYDFFSNPKVGWLNLLGNHQAQTIQRIQDPSTEFVYIIQDSTFYNYTAHKAKIDIGNIGKQGRFTQFGFLQHTALCISEKDLPLGILELDFMGYDDDLKSAAHREGFEAIASSRWRRFLAQITEKLQKVDKNIIILCDREADFFEFLSDLYGGMCKFVIRSKWDRLTGISGRARKDRFSELFNQVSPIGNVQLIVSDPHTHKEQLRLFSIKTLKDIMLPAIHRGAGHPQNKLPPIQINLVEASDGQNHWILLTNLPVHTLGEAIFVIDAYRKRWHIELLHKVLKTAYRAEQIYLHSSREAVQNLLTMINIAASQTYWLIHQARQSADIPATQCFSPQEITALHIYLFHRPSDTYLAYSLKDIYYQVAQLGGYKNLNNKHPPGILTIYRGIKKLSDITQMYTAIMSIET